MTPGPWAVRIGADGLWLIAASETATTMVVVAREIDDDEDAALMASAPRLRAINTELLAALEGLKWKSIDRDNMEFSCTTTCYRMDEIRAAIARAKGGAT